MIHPQSLEHTNVWNYYTSSGFWCFRPKKKRCNRVWRICPRPQCFPSICPHGWKNWLYVKIEDKLMKLNFYSHLIFVPQWYFVVAFKLYDLRQTGFIEPEEVSVEIHLSLTIIGGTSSFLLIWLYGFLGFRSS